MRAIWKGSVSFGLVNVPVKLYGATEDHDVALHQVHAADGGRIRYKRVCEVCGEEVAYQDIARGFDDGERIVVLTDKDLAALPVEKNKEIAIVQFVPSEQISPLLFDKAYYLQPETAGRKPYTLLRRTLEETERVAIATVSLRQRSRLAVLRVVGDVLSVHTLHWADEIREAELATEPARVTKEELKMSLALVDAYSGDFEPEKFTDEYAAELRTLVEAKSEAGEGFDRDAAFAGEEGEPSGEVINLMDALRRSIERSRAS